MEFVVRGELSGVAGGGGRLQFAGWSKPKCCSWHWKGPGKLTATPRLELWLVMVTVAVGAGMMKMVARLGAESRFAVVRRPGNWCGGAEFVGAGAKMTRPAGSVTRVLVSVYALPRSPEVLIQDSRRRQ